MKNNLHIIVEHISSSDTKDSKLPLDKHYNKNFSAVKLPSSGSIYAKIEEFKKEVDKELAKHDKEYKQLTEEAKKYNLLNEKLRKEYDARVKKHNSYNVALERKKIEEKVALKYKDVRWIWCTIDGKLKFDVDDHNLDYAEGTTENWFTVPKVLEGGGLVYLEAFHKDNTPANEAPIGLFVRADGKPEIVAVEWRYFKNDNKGEKIPKETKLPFGGTIQLHVYTAGLYGQEIDIQLMNDDWSDDNLPAFERKDGVAVDLKPKQEVPDMPQNTFFTREVKTERLKEGESVPSTAVKGMLNAQEVKGKNQANLSIQKAVVNVYVDPFWKAKAFADAETITIYAKVKYTGAKEYKSFESDYITIEGKEIVSELTPVGNKAVVIGTIETDDANFRPCRYNKIELKQQNKAGSVIVFDSSNMDHRKKEIIEVEIVAGKKETYLLDFDLKTTECEMKPQKHLNNELVVYSVPNDYEFTIEPSSKASHTVKKTEFKLYKTESSSKYSLLGSSSTSKETVKKEKGIVKVRQSQLEFDGFYNYDIPQNEEDTLAVFEKAIEYFWLPDLGNKIQFISMAANSCAFKKNIKISIYPDIKWTLKFGFNVKKEDVEALNAKGLKTPLKVFEALEEGNKLNQEAADKRSKEFLDQNNELKKIENKQINETRKKFKLKKKLKKAEEPTPEAKGKFAGLIEILKRVTISLSEEHYGGDQKNELSEEFVKQFYNSYQGQFEMLAEAADIIEGNKDNTNNSGDAIGDYMKDHGKSVAGLKEKLKRKPTEYEILYPKLALAGSWFYEQIDATQYPALAGRQGLGIDINFSAKPLMGITIKWDLLELLCRKHPIAYALLKAIDALLYVLADDESAVRCDFSVTGQIDADVKWQHNMLAGFKDLSAKGKSALQAEVKLELKIAKSMKVAKFAAVVKLGFSAGASIGLGIIDNFGVDAKGVYIQKDLAFEGIKLSFEAEGSGELTSETGKRKKTLVKVSKKIEGEITMLSHTFSTDKMYFK